MKPSAALSDLKTASNVRPTTFDAITGAFDRIDIRGAGGASLRSGSERFAMWQSDL
jgi:hypothetical protein